MTLIKSLLLGSAAGIVAVASAQAADLPTKKGAPAAEYVKVCSVTVGGKPVVGFTIPGSDTCLKISGYITAQIEAGNLNTARTYSFAAGGAQTATTSTTGRDSFGYTTRYNLTVDAVSNTAMGPLAAHGEFQFNHGEGFDNTGQGGSDGGLNRAYVTWAGITAGKTDSFFSATGGGPGWANFFSPDRKGFNQPDVLAYTAAFGGGFSATLSAESYSRGAENYIGQYAWNGMRSPDFVVSLDAAQSWGSAHLAGIAHNVYVSVGAASQNTWGYGVSAGLTFNLPSLGAGDDFQIGGAYTRNAMLASGLPDGMWGEGGSVNGNGQTMPLADTFFNGTGWQAPTAWSIEATMDHHFSPVFSLSPEVAYG